MALHTLSLHSFFSVESYREDRWAKLSAYISRRLDVIATKLDRADLCFEACEAEELSEAFTKFVETDGDSEDFAILWNDLVEWCETDVEVGSKQMVLCSRPQLPDRYAC